MNYRAHYEKLIDRANGRVLTGYIERHHVIPRCMGGSDDKSNLVSLTAEEHYVAHQLLMKMYPGVLGLASATAIMGARCTGNKSYGWVRRQLANALRGNKLTLGRAPWNKGIPQTVDVKRKLSEALRGKKQSKETIDKRRSSLIGNQWNVGKKLSEETRAKMSESHKGRPVSPAALASLIKRNLGNKYNLGKKLSDETKAKIALRLSGNKHRLGHTNSPEARAKISLATKGRKRPPFPAEWRANMAAALRGRPVSQETRAKMSASRKRVAAEKRMAQQMSVGLSA